MSKITKAVIPCGGRGTRFLPITKAVPKEILPVIDTPVVAHIVNEAADSGITDVMLVLGNGKDAIRKYFTPDAELEDALIKAGKTEYLELVRSIHNRVNIVYEYQKEPKGSGDAVHCAKNFTGDEAFCLAWGDDLVYARNPVMGQLISAYEKVRTPILGVQRIDGDEITAYGVAKIESGDGRFYKCSGLVEKPPLDALPSRFASLGRYVVTPGIYAELEALKPGQGGEYQFTDALAALIKTEGLYAYDFEGRRYDMGSKYGAVQATVEYYLRGDKSGKFREYLLSLSEKLK